MTIELVRWSGRGWVALVLARLVHCSPNPRKVAVLSLAHLG